MDQDLNRSEVGSEVSHKSRTTVSSRTSSTRSSKVCAIVDEATMKAELLWKQKTSEMRRKPAREEELKWRKEQLKTETELAIVGEVVFYGPSKSNGVKLKSDNEFVNQTSSTRSSKVCAIVPGYCFGSHMKTDDHVNQLSRILNFHIRNLNRIRRFLDFDAFHYAVRALILSKLDYCSCLLNGLTQKNITRLQRIQNRCAKLIFKRPKLTHASPLLHDLHWLPVTQRIKFRTLVHVFKCFNNLSPTYLSSLLSTQKSSYFLRSSKGLLCNFPRSHTLTGDHAFSIPAPRLWHCLPQSVRNSTSITSFKKALRTHLFSDF